MKVCRSPQTLKKAVSALRKKNKRIGFVPTMGFLHQGHLSLVRQARKVHGAVVVSIFLNPLQFGPAEDLARYPRNSARDRKLLRQAKADILYLPDRISMYPKDFETTVSVKRLSFPLCGRTRPTHFAGVATVVLKLLNLVGPDFLYLGLKDYQQCRVLSRMVTDLNVPVRIVLAPIVREPDGLAMSSRNINLTADERAQATALYRALRGVRDLIVRQKARDVGSLQKAMRTMIGKEARLGRVDYARIVDAVKHLAEVGDR